MMLFVDYLLDHLLDHLLHLLLSLFLLDDVLDNAISFGLFVLILDYAMAFILVFDILLMFWILLML